MPLTPGSRLGPYEVLSPIGAGGMGEVWRARDPRLGRDVAIKVLPASYSADEDRLRRFEQEARAAGILNHPNVTAVYDIGSHEGAPYVVQELLEGETLRSILAGGRLSQRRAIDYSLQIAHGLAAAHEKGIVHRDLKPENVFVTKDGRVKILDFGLAKLTHLEEGSHASNLPTIGGTEPGVILGTIGYMSPEQVRGNPADARSDIFSFGAILYEMLSGNRAFHGATAADTMSAILREDPPDLSITNQNVSPGLDRIVRHCLEKNPEQRFHSAHDVAFALDALSGTSAPAAGTSPAASQAGRRRALPIGAALLALLALLAGAAAGFLARGLTRAKPSQPSFKRLTFRRGTVWTARFAPDGQTVVYSAAWETNPIEVFLTRPESPESRPLDLKAASLLAVSSTGELAVMLNAKTTARSYERFGTLARVPLAGGSPRPLLENIRYADWSPDGRELMIERTAGGKHLLEFPPGKVVYETTGRIDNPRLSPAGDSIAFFETGVEGYGLGRTAIRLTDLSGKARTLARMSDWWNLAWSADGKEIWYSAPEPDAPLTTESLQAVSLSGKRRLLLRFPGILEFHDVSKDGRVLLARVALRPEVIGLAPGDPKERPLTWLDATQATDLSRDGGTLLLTEAGEGGGGTGSMYLRKTDGSPATLIGEGVGEALSPDGRWVLANSGSPRQIVLLPTGPGAPRALKFDGVTGDAGCIFTPDGKTILLQDVAPGSPTQLYVGSIQGGKPRPLAPKGFHAGAFGSPISPDGKLVAVLDPDGKVFLAPVEGGNLKPVAGLERGEFPIQWSADGRSLYTHRGGEIPAKVWRFDLATGRRELFKEFSPADPAGVTSIETILVTPDGRSYVYGYAHNLSDLYIVDGL
ncbi:MAG TPA: protein kinase, partial [Thermoanaerobaculia bacterium]|nr:protein kinase [Thermoanaerobaculia bacterium]